MDDKKGEKMSEGDEFKESFKMYKRVLEEHPEIIETTKQNKILKQLNKLFGYELKTQLGGVIKLNNIIKNNF